MGSVFRRGILFALILGISLFQIPGRRFFFAHLSIDDVAGFCGTRKDHSYPLSKFQAAVVRSCEASASRSNVAIFTHSKVQPALRIAFFVAPLHAVVPTAEPRSVSPPGRAPPVLS